jgi:hypothetical protein
MARARVSFLSDAEKGDLHEQTLDVLEHTGIAFNTPHALDLLEDAGAAVSRRCRATCSASSWLSRWPSGGSRRRSASGARHRLPDKRATDVVDGRGRIAVSD